MKEVVDCEREEGERRQQEFMEQHREDMHDLREKAESALDIRNNDVENSWRQQEGLGKLREEIDVERRRVQERHDRELGDCFRGAA